MVLHVMRVKAAAVRHSVWAAVVLLMLVLPIWRGPKASLRVLLPPLSMVLFKLAPESSQCQSE